MDQDKMEEQVPENTDNEEIMFTSEDFPELVRIFKEADVDGSGGLDTDEFCEAMKELFPNAKAEDLLALHMKIDANCDYNVDLGELLDYVSNSKKAVETLDHKNQLFPRPFKVIPVDHYKSIVSLMYCPLKDEDVPNVKRKKSDPKNDTDDSSDQTRPYKTYQYISITSDGLLKIWGDDFKSSRTVSLQEKQEEAPPFSHQKKISVTDMVYIKELNRIAVSTSEREVLFCFYNQSPLEFGTQYSLIEEENFVNVLNYWSDGKKAIFSFGDAVGSFSFFISNDVNSGLFSPKAFEMISLRPYRSAYVSTLLKNQNNNFNSFRIALFIDECSQIKYFQCIESFAVCGRSSKVMALVCLSFHSKSSKPRISKKVFRSTGHHAFFSCAEYSPWSDFMLTGGTDGSMRIWLPFKNTSCALDLPGHKTPVTHLVYNTIENIFISLSVDQNIRVWTDGDWICRQSFFVECLSKAPITSLYYNTHNNELFVANSSMARCLGCGTDIFKDELTSHYKPVSSMLYHGIFKQIISVCWNGMVTVWDVFTGKAVMQFKITSDDCVGPIIMVFDQPQRKLITADQDGNISQWNFNNGINLGTISLTVPKRVTSILCREDRLYVAARHMSVLFDFDTDNCDHRFWKHRLLKDIACVDVHEPILVTGSSTGNVVIWDIETTEVLFYLTTSDNPRTCMALKGDQGHVTTKFAQRKQKKGKEACMKEEEISIGFHFICLKTREVTCNTATVLSTNDGYIFAWSTLIKGGLIGKFKAVDRDDAFITSMVTDMKEDNLVTGDSTGRVCWWNISDFGFKTRDDKGPFEKIQGWPVSLCPPPLLGSWEAHQSKLVSVACDPLCKNIITASLDCNVKLWTNSGTYVGLFGKDTWRQISAQSQAKEKTDQEKDKKTDTPPAISEGPQESPPPSPSPSPSTSPSPLPSPPPSPPLSPSLIDLQFSIKTPVKAIIDEVMFPQYAVLNVINEKSQNFASELQFWKKETQEWRKELNRSTMKIKERLPDKYHSESPQKQQSAGMQKSGLKPNPGRVQPTPHPPSKVQLPAIAAKGELTHLTPQSGGKRLKDKTDKPESKHVHLPPITGKGSLTPPTTGQDGTAKQGSKLGSSKVQFPPIAAKGQLTRAPLIPPIQGQSSGERLKDGANKPGSKRVHLPPIPKV